jgi:hypothetical protein
VHHVDRHEEGGRNLLLALALLAQGEEGAELVEGMQRRPPAMILLVISS